jgi:hypothetical protein
LLRYASGRYEHFLATNREINMLRSLAAACLLALAAVDAAAQGPLPATQTITIKVPQAVKIDVNTPAVDLSADATLDATIVAALENTGSYTYAGVPGGWVRVRTNSVGWTLTADAVDFTSGGDTKPKSDLSLSFKPSASGTFGGYSAFGAAALDLETSGARGSSVYDLQYQILYDIDDPVGTYTTTVTYTLSGY